MAEGREAGLARVSYVGALGRLAEAHGAWRECGVQLDPRLPGHMDLWTAEQTQVMERVASAMAEAVRRKIDYDNMRRSGHRPPH